MALEETNTLLGEVPPVDTDIVVFFILSGAVELDAGFCRAFSQMYKRFASTKKIRVNSRVVGWVA